MEDIAYTPPVFTRHQFQIEDLEFFKRRKASANYSDMGCFKTSTALFLAEDLDLKTILIITTRTGKIAYADALPAILPDHVVYDIQGRSQWPRSQPNGMPGVWLTHYGQYTGTNINNASAVAKWARKFEWDLWIGDESHRIKNRKAQCTKQITYIKARYKHIMSGTPYINDPSEIWSQLKALDSEIPGYWAFRNYFCEQDEMAGYSVVTGLKPERKEEFKKYVFYFARRRTKKEVFPELPDKLLYPPIKVKLNTTQRRMYDEIKNELETLDANGEMLSSPNVLALFTRLRQIADATPVIEDQVWNEKLEKYDIKIRLTEPSSKLDALMEMLPEMQGKTVIFTQFVDMAELTHNRLMSKYTVEWLRQRDSDIERARKVRAFQAGNVDIFLTTLQLGSESITLTAAQNGIMLDRSWSPKDNNQAIDRLHRPGQTMPVNVHFIEGHNTIDGYIRHKNNKKVGWFKEAFAVDSYPLLQL